MHENNLEFLRYGSYYTENPRVAGSIPALATIYSLTYLASFPVIPPRHPPRMVVAKPGKGKNEHNQLYITG